MWSFYPGLFEGQLCPHGGQEDNVPNLPLPWPGGAGSFARGGETTDANATGLGSGDSCRGGGASGPQDEPCHRPGEATWKYGPSSAWPFSSQGHSGKTDLTLHSRNEPCPDGVMSCDIPVALSPTPLRPERFPWPPSELCRPHRISSVASPLNMTALLGGGRLSPCRETPRLSRVRNPHTTQPGAGHTSCSRRSRMIISLCGSALTLWTCGPTPASMSCLSLLVFLKNVNQYQHVETWDFTGESDSLTLKVSGGGATLGPRPLTVATGGTTSRLPL